MVSAANVAADSTHAGDRPEGVDHPRDLAYLRRHWRMQRVAWLGMLAFLVFALFGATGRGLLAQQERALPGGVVTWDRVMRHAAPTEIRVSLVAGTSTLTLERELASALNIERVVPEPLSMSVQGNDVVMHLDAQGPTEVTLMSQPMQMGRHRGDIGLGGERITIGFFVLP